MKQNKKWIKNRVAPKGSKEALKYGKAKTEEEKRHLSEASPKFWQGKTRDEETKQKIRETKEKNGDYEKSRQLFSKTVYKIDLITKKYEIYSSTGEAGKIIGKDQATVSRWCKNNKVIQGYRWSYEIPENK